MNEINLHPDNTQPDNSILNGNKGLLIAIVLGIIAVVIGISAFLNSSSSNKYQGLIRQVENETEQLKAQNN